MNQPNMTKQQWSGR